MAMAIPIPIPIHAIAKPYLKNLMRFSSRCLDGLCQIPDSAFYDNIGM
jgi:hypothetical protein